MNDSEETPTQLGGSRASRYVKVISEHAPSKTTTWLHGMNVRAFLS
ncbi:MAG: hypothetical protein ACI9MB_004991, partial [Verrucomicrobiales bacterium]